MPVNTRRLIIFTVWLRLPININLKAFPSSAVSVFFVFSIPKGLIWLFSFSLACISGEQSPEVMVTEQGAGTDTLRRDLGVPAGRQGSSSSSRWPAVPFH